MSRPMYRVIAEDLRERIETGVLEPGAQLPTETELRETYDASRNTIREAIKWLTQLGLTETRPGRGTFVAKKIEPVVNAIGPYLPGEVAGPLAEVASSRRGNFSPPQVEIQQAGHLAASGLHRPEGTEVISRHEQRYVDSAPWSMQTAFYPMEYAHRGAERLLKTWHIETGTLSYLSDTLYVRMETWQARLSARAANQNESDFLQLRPGSFVVEIFHTYYEQSGRPFCFLVTVFPADRNLFQVTAGSVPSFRELRLYPRAGRIAENLPVWLAVVSCGAKGDKAVFGRLGRVGAAESVNADASQSAGLEERRILWMRILCGLWLENHRSPVLYISG
jgi:GntR family transcriptional regulator